MILWIAPKTKVKKESTPEPKRSNPNGTEHYCYSQTCVTEATVRNVCRNLINEGYINFTVFHTLNKNITFHGSPTTIVDTNRFSIHIYIPK